MPMTSKQSIPPSPILKAHSPAALAEEYLIQSIWNKHFPPNSDLPSERDLAEKIGVTRTTLREVLQRLARDGWLTIQHGKPTKVNDVWETSGLNILEVLVRLDHTISPFLISNMLAVRTQIASIYIPKAFKNAKKESLELLKAQIIVSEDAESYTEFDYNLFQKLAFVSKNPIYGMVLNSVRGFYRRLGKEYFQFPEARQLAKKFYQNLLQLCESDNIEQVANCIYQYGKDSSAIWATHEESLYKNIFNSN